MRSTMPDFPLTLQHFLWRSTTLFPRKEIVTRREGGRHRYTYADFGRRVAQLAHALRELGIAPGDRVGTLAWNNYRHFELYYGVSGIGAVCHTINPRLFDEQIVYIINHAQDRLLFIDTSFIPLVERLRPQLPADCRFVLLEPAETTLPVLATYDELVDAEDEAGFVWPELDEWSASALCY